MMTTADQVQYLRGKAMVQENLRAEDPIDVLADSFAELRDMHTAAADALERRDAMEARAVAAETRACTIADAAKALFDDVGLDEWLASNLHPNDVWGIRKKDLLGLRDAMKENNDAI